MKTKALILLFFLCCVSAYCKNFDEIEKISNSKYLVTIYQSIENITPQEAIKLAKNKAYNKTLDYEEIEVSASSMILQTSENEKFKDIFAKYVCTSSSGTIIGSSILEEKKFVENNRVFLKLVIEVKVGKHKKKKDPYFNIEANLNKDNIREGESLSISVKSSKDCYITVLDIQSNNSINQIFPNQFQSDNYLAKNKTLNLPTEQEIKLGLEYVSSLLEGKDSDLELIKIIATKKPLYLLLDSEDDENQFEKLQETLIRIPRDEIEIVDLPIYIYKR